MAIDLLFLLSRFIYLSPSKTPPDTSWKLEYTLH